MQHDTTKLEAEQDKLENNVNELADKINQAVEQNARVAQDQVEYEKKYNRLVRKFDEANARLDEVKNEIILKQGKQEKISLFLEELNKTGVIDQFDESLFRSLVEQLTVKADGKVIVQFKNDSEVEVRL